MVGSGHSSVNDGSVERVPDEYLDASEKGTAPQDWPGFEAQVRALYKRMARISIQAKWAKVLDFETRLPDFLAELISQQSGM
jgi:hypothetical protein